MDYVLKQLEITKKMNPYNEVEFPDGSVIGFSAYSINKINFFILLSEISFKKEYLRNREGNFFYDKISTFIAEIAHEVGNPLTSVITTLQVLLNNLEHWEILQKKEYIHISICELNRLVHFLKRLRGFSKDRVLKKKIVSLRTLIDKVVFQKKADLNIKKIRVRIQVPESIRVFVDEDALFQVLYNLFQNSTEALHMNGEVCLFIDRRNPISEFYVKLIYTNNGPPISEEVLNKIFLPFYSTKDEGRGQGLDIALKLITRMGGTINAVKPIKKKGCKFVLYIPVKDLNLDGNDNKCL